MSGPMSLHICFATSRRKKSAFVSSCKQPFDITTNTSRPFCCNRNETLIERLIFCSHQADSLPIFDYGETHDVWECFAMSLLTRVGMILIFLSKSWHGNESGRPA